MAGILGGIGGIVGGIIGASQKGGRGYIRDALKVLQAVKLANYDSSKLSPAQLAVVQQVIPELYDAIVPPEAKTTAGGQEARAGQMQALSRLQDIGAAGLPLQDRLAAEEAQNAMADEARRGHLAVLQGLAQRGRLGAGSELSGMAGYGQQAANLARAQGNDVMRAALGNRLAALQAAGGLGGQIRGQDIGTEQFNANAINRFNEYVANARTEAAYRNALERARAQTMNTQIAQDIANRNPILRYQNEQYNQQNYNQLQEQAFKDQMAKALAVSGAQTNLGQFLENEKWRKAQAIQQASEGAGDVLGGALGPGGLLG